MPRELRLRSCCLLLCRAQAAFLAGCGGSSAALLPVEGAVTADGKALTRGSVGFHPDSAKGNTAERVSSAEISDNGTYKVYTDGKPGAPAGWYKVTVVSMSEVDSGQAESAKSFVAAKFNDPKETPLTVEVKPSPPAGHYDLKATQR